MGRSAGQLAKQLAGRPLNLFPMFLIVPRDPRNGPWTIANFGSAVQGAFQEVRFSARTPHAGTLEVPGFGVGSGHLKACLPRLYHRM